VLAIELHYVVRLRFHPAEWTLRIEKDSQSGTTTIRLIGRFQSEHIRELEKQFEECGPSFVLDLEEVTLVDVDVVRFLGACEADGTKIAQCSQYIREWIVRECEG
jgi:hypothetical protein